MQVSGSIAEAIKTRIASGEWVVNQRLPSITQLAQVFGVGTGSIHKALKALTILGVLRVEHGRGTFVAAVPPRVDLYKQFQDIDTGSILGLCEARRILEPELAAFAAEHGNHSSVLDASLRQRAGRQVRAASGAPVAVQSAPLYEQRPVSPARRGRCSGHPHHPEVARLRAIYKGVILMICTLQRAKAVGLAVPVML